VGDQLNSINPVTGMPEFFFKSIFKSIGKVVKKVVKVAKKIAPIALPIAASVFGIPFLPAAFFGPASIGAAALSSGIGTLIGGGNLKDAFKSALFSGGTAGVFGALKGATPTEWGLGGTGGWEGAMKGVGKAFYNPAAATPSQVWSSLTTDLGEGEFKTAAKNVLKGEYKAQPPYAAPAPSQTQFDNMLDSVITGDYAPAPSQTPFDNMLDSVITGDYAPVPGVDLNYGYVGAAESPITSALTTTTAPSRDWSDTLGDWAFRGGLPLETIAQNTAKAESAYLAKMAAAGIQPSEAGLKAAAASAQPGMMATWGPTVGVAGLGLYGLGAFDTAKEEEITTADIPSLGGPRLTPAERQALANEQQLSQDALNPSFFTPNPDVLQPSMFPVAQVAAGGSVSYPERDLLVEGPGTEKSDDIPAMLSDGEFVINSKAVRGADPSGGGDRYAGAQNLYNIMRNFEMRA